MKSIFLALFVVAGFALVSASSAQAAGCYSGGYGGHGGYRGGGYRQSYARPYHSYHRGNYYAPRVRYGYGGRYGGGHYGHGGFGLHLRGFGLHIH